LAFFLVVVFVFVLRIDFFFFMSVAQRRIQAQGCIVKMTSAIQSDSYNPL
jgi:hypothetical protein